MRLVQYNYSSIDFQNLPPFQKTMQVAGYIKIVFPQSATTPVLTFEESSTFQYALSAIYLFSSPQRGLHPVLGNYQAELIFEHSPITNGETLFLCFPVRTYGLQDKPTFLDDLIWNNGTSASAILEEGKALMYGTSVILAKTPLFMQTNPAPFAKSGIMDTLSVPSAGFPEEIQLKDGSRPIFVEGFDDPPQNETEVSDVYDFVECEPIDISAEEVPMLQVPYNSDTLANTSTKIFMSTTFSIFITGFILLLYVVFIPILVPQLIILLKPVEEKTAVSLILLTNILWLFASVIFVVYGALVVKNSPGVLNAAFIVLMLVAGLLVGLFLLFNYRGYATDGMGDILKNIGTIISYLLFYNPSNTSIKIKRAFISIFAIFLLISIIVEGILMGIGYVQAGLLIMILGTLAASGYTGWFTAKAFGPSPAPAS